MHRTKDLIDASVFQSSLPESPSYANINSASALPALIILSYWQKDDLMDPVKQMRKSY